MPVGYTRPEVAYQIPRWNKIRDCLAGEDEVKQKREKYLPKPNATDKSKENEQRYKDYLTRAVFYGVTKRTLDGYVGQVFARDPIIDVPDSMKPMLEDVDGAGVSLVQQAKKALAADVAYGRVALLADYPPAEVDADGIPVAASQEEIDEGFVRPTISLYEPWEVINWRTVSIGARRVFALVVIAEPFIAYDDGFEVKSEQQYRVLRLVPPPFDPALGETPMWREATYKVEIWRLTSDAASATASGAAASAARQESYAVVEVYEPRDASGALLREIPFTFIGALNNDPGVDHPPLYDLAGLNLAHYRNSADYEEVCYLLGQPTPWVSGLTKAWVDDVINRNGKFMLGSRAPLMLPEKGAFGLAQISANGMLREAMDSKERNMVALGAKLVEHRQVQRTATEAQQDDAAAASQLATIAGNVSAAYTFCLRKCAEFIGAAFPAQAANATVEDDAAPPPREIRLKLNTEFPLTKMTPQEIDAVVRAWQASAIAESEMRARLRSGGLATLDDGAYQDEIDQRPPLPAYTGAAMGATAAGGDVGAGEGDPTAKAAA
jgi:hypothetical protein